MLGAALNIVMLLGGLGGIAHQASRRNWPAVIWATSYTVAVVNLIVLRLT